MPSIIISKNGKDAKKIERAELESESVLQEYIYNNPEVIPIDEIESGLKLFVAAREFQVGSGRIDALGFDQNGNIYVIETKLARNADKRTVVAQVLDYGASLWGAQDADDFLNEVSDYTQNNFGKAFQAALAEYFELEDVTDILNRIRENIASGNIRFIVMMDEVEPHLKDLVRFINQNSKYDVYAVETSFYRNDDQEIMTAEMFGDEVKKEMGVRTKSGSTWDKCAEADYVRAVCSMEEDSRKKEQILRLLGILKNVIRHTVGTVDFYHAKSLRLDDYRLAHHVFYLNHNGTMNIFVTSPEYVNSATSDYLRVVMKEVNSRGIFNVPDISEHKTVWPVPRECLAEEYGRFVDIFEEVAREKGYIEKYSEKDFRDFVDSQEWINAKTYESTSPHEYIVIKPDNPSRKDYLEALKFLFGNGIEEAFYDKVYTRYILDGRKYWSMERSLEDVDDETIVLNRTRPEDTYRIYE